MRRAALALAGLLLLGACGGGLDTEAGTDTGAGGGAARPAAPGAVAPSPAPAADLDYFDGRAGTLADLVGEPVVLNFWASWCGPCVQEMPDLEAVHARRDDVRFVGINTRDNPDDAAALAEETGVTYDLARDPDGALFERFAGRGMPTTIFVDAEGRIVGRHTGVLTEESLDQRLDAFFG